MNFQRGAWKKNISIEMTGNINPIVYTDKKWCGFIVRQLLTNAIKYSPEGGNICIQVSIDINKHVNVTINDEGTGIQSHDLPRIFDKGFTGENGRIQHSATGMGLYLAKEISKKLHIRLNADSTLGKGTSILMVFSSANSVERIRRSIL
ncbi:ATP-binding protein [Geomicrobium sp. JCM 19055]|uniref:ATP-binding protein n=1 Tax=Geomicrobium sp. JCM 19055 TaxID=1460649 RepID=UPI0022360497|nr:ATP-binding protein [Geomicrobium sp. JCM 19055]